MGFHTEARESESPYIQTVTRGWTEGSGSVIRPAESHWHMVLVKYQAKTQFIVTGALPTSGVVSYTEGAEILWIKLNLGTFLPHLPARIRLDKETVLPHAVCNSFWLGSVPWQFPNFDNVETFINRLVRAEVLACDPLVSAVLQDQRHQEMAPRTVRYRFVQATGLSHAHIRQIERAQQAAALLRQGVPILDTVYQAGYFDQPHLTRAVKRWVGYTPAQLAREARGCSQTVADSV
jgi:AraC-like DNA-binding protein